MIYTIGHSTHPIEHFISLLHGHGVDALADVRSVPYSRYNPQFNREALSETLKEQGIAYVFLGKELGGRSKDPVPSMGRWERVGSAQLIAKSGL